MRLDNAGSTSIGRLDPSRVAVNATPVEGAKRRARKYRGVSSSVQSTDGSRHVRKTSTNVSFEIASVRTESWSQGVGTMTIPDTWCTPFPSSSRMTTGRFSPDASACAMFPTTRYVAYARRLATTKNHTMRENIAPMGTVYRQE